MVGKGKRFVAYLRVSTTKQGDSGLGIEAQREAVAKHVAAQGGRIVAELVEIESGRKNERPQLAVALDACRRHRAVLVIAKLDRLARNAAFLLSVVEGTGEDGVVFCDLPTVPAGPVGKFIITNMAAAAELEAGLASQRTKAALAAAKARGVKLGGDRDGAYAIREHAADGNVVSAAVRSDKASQRAASLSAAVDELRSQGAVTLKQIAEGLNGMDIPAPRGGGWAPIQALRLLKQIEKVTA